MAELRQKSVGVDTQFQNITPTKKADTREQQFQAISKGVSEAGGELAKAQGESDANDFAGTFQTGREVKADRDLFITDVDVNTAQAEMRKGDFLTKEEEGFIREDTLNTASLTAKGLQDAYNRGLISKLEATSRANMEIQSMSNSLLGSLFQKEYQNAFSGITGNPSGSPATIFNDSPAHI